MQNDTIELTVYYNHKEFTLQAQMDENVETLAAQIETLTGIDPDHQTLIVEDDVLYLD